MIDTRPFQEACDALNRRKPSTLKKRFGSNGPSPEQLLEYQAEVKTWNSAYRKASKAWTEAREQSIREWEAASESERKEWIENRG